MRTKLRYSVWAKRTDVGSRNISRDGLGAPHPGNHCRDCFRRQAEPQGERGKLVEGDAGVTDNRLHGVPDPLFTATAEVVVAKITFGKLCFRRQLAGQRSFVERHPHDDSNTVLLAVRKELVLGRLVEDVVDDLHAVDEPSLQSLEHVRGLMALDGDAGKAHFSRELQLSYRLLPFGLISPFVDPGMELVDVDLFPSEGAQRLLERGKDVCARKCAA